MRNDTKRWVYRECLAVCYALYYCSKFFQFDVFSMWPVGLNERPDTHIINMLTSIRGVSSGKHLKASQTSLLHVTKLMSSEDVHMGEVCSPSVCCTSLSGFIYIMLWCSLYKYKALRLLSSRMCMWKINPDTYVTECSYLMKISNLSNLHN